MNQKRLIVNADDFGQSTGINKGIIHAHENGIVTSASLMVRYPAVTEAVTYSKSHKNLGVGLHLDLGEWYYSNGQWKVLYAVVNMEDIEAVRNEINRQLDTFRQLTGKNPTHIDSHQHVHLRDNILPVAKDVARQLNITLRRQSNKVNYVGDFYGQAEDGSHYLQAISVDALQIVISRIIEGITEIACHPGFADDMQTMYKNERQIEVQTLCDQRIIEAVIKSGIELGTFENISF